MTIFARIDAVSGQVPPATFGHEWTGTISRVGAAVATVRTGDRVVAAVGPACGTCAMCRAGHADHCDLAFAEANGVTSDAPRTVASPPAWWSRHAAWCR